MGKSGFSPSILYAIFVDGTYQENDVSREKRTNPGADQRCAHANIPKNVTRTIKYIKYN